MMLPIDHKCSETPQPIEVRCAPRLLPWPSGKNRRPQKVNQPSCCAAYGSFRFLLHVPEPIVQYALVSIRHLILEGRNLAAEGSTIKPFVASVGIGDGSDVGRVADAKASKQNTRATSTPTPTSTSISTSSPGHDFRA